MGCLCKILESGQKKTDREWLTAGYFQTGILVGIGTRALRDERQASGLRVNIEWRNAVKTNRTNGATIFESCLGVFGL